MHFWDHQVNCLVNQPYLFGFVVISPKLERTHLFWLFGRATSVLIFIQPQCQTTNSRHLSFGGGNAAIAQATGNGDGGFLRPSAPLVPQAVKILTEFLN